MNYLKYGMLSHFIEICPDSNSDKKLYSDIKYKSHRPEQLNHKDKINKMHCTASNAVIT